jgi:asparagine synthase (glutamine-hydrolysing)
MCGLIAVVSDFNDILGAWEEGKVLPDISKHTERIRHRGPDGMDTLTNASFQMGHTRLAIVDPSDAGNQPFSLPFSNGKIYHLVANGEIYNHEEIHARLADEHGWAEPRVSGSDCEAIVHAYAARGVDCVNDFDGMFAFVILEEDAQTGKMVSAFAARDPVGIKPLYYGRQKNDSSYVFASELKALVDLADPATVVAIPPGHCWTPEGGLQCYYNPDWLRKVRETVTSNLICVFVTWAPPIESS